MNQLEIENIKIEELKDLLSVRSVNVCLNNNLNTIGALVSYFQRKADFYDLKNCGKRTNKELTDLCLKYSVFPSESTREYLPYSDKSVRKTLADLDSKDWDSFILNIETSAKVLSIRSQNVIQGVIEKKKKFVVLRDLLILKHEPLRVKNVGRKSSAELVAFLEGQFEWLRDIIRLNQKGENQENKDFRNLLFQIRSQLNIDHQRLEISKDEFFSTNFKLFSLIQQICLLPDFYKNRNEYYIFLNAIEFVNCLPKKNLQDIADRLGITRERVRQIRNNIIITKFKEFDFLIEFLVYTSYQFNDNNEVLYIDSNLVEEINVNENTDLTRDFITRIIKVLYRDKFIFGTDFIFSGNLKNQGYTSSIIQDDRRLRYYFILDRDLGSKINFKNLFFDIGKLMQSRIEDDVKLEKSKYLSQFVVDLDRKKIAIISLILEKEFSITIHRGQYTYIPLEVDHEYIIIRRNTKMKNYEYIYKVLEKLGQPSHVNAIKQELARIFPLVEIQSISGAILRHDDIFISIGRSSTYGLRKWEKQGKVKGGTIRKIAKEFLKKWDSPKHINEITLHVQRYREKTNAYSIFYNLKIMNPVKTPFIFFKGGYIGLKSKTYYDGMNSNSSNSPTTLDDFIADFF